MIIKPLFLRRHNVLDMERSIELDCKWYYAGRRRDRISVNGVVLKVPRFVWQLVAWRSGCPVTLGGFLKYSWRGIEDAFYPPIKRQKKSYMAIPAINTHAQNP